MSRSVLCTEPFDGAEGNLKRAIVVNSICTDEKCSATRMCVARLFSLLQLWDYDVPNSDRINQECQVRELMCTAYYVYYYLIKDNVTLLLLFFFS